MINVNLENVQAAEEGRSGLAPGGYVCGITSVVNQADKEYIKIEFDIAQGEFKNYYRSLFEAHKFWGGSFIRSYKQRALPFFKGFITAVEKSNAGYKWNGDEQQLRRKLIGLVLGEEEYYSTAHSETRKRLYVAAVKTVDDINKEFFEVPELKKLSQNQSGGAMEFTAAEPIISNEDDLPF